MPIQRGRAATSPLLGDEHEAERRVQDPGGELPEEGHLELEAARREQLVADDEGEVACEDDERRGEREAAGRPHEHDRGPDHQPVGERVGDRPEARLDVPAACEVAVDLVREGRGREEEPCPPRRPSPASR